LISQASLVHAQKMAALGQLTAGIAHEIKNPLNFVNNFAELSGELLLELKETTAPVVAVLGDDERAAVDEVVEMLRGNFDKIAEHGKRADGIVKSMLEHSRGVSGERRMVDLNALVEEALNLAYHGARAQDASFNITLEREFDRRLAPTELAPQEMTRVFLNLFGNGFYATAKRQHDGAGPQFRPTLKVATRDLGGAVEVRVRDNGTGIAPEIRDKLFQPFITTKPVRRRWPSAGAQNENLGTEPSSRTEPAAPDNRRRMQPKPVIFALSRACIARGTGSSNPSPSSGASANFRFLVTIICLSGNSPAGSRR
jgi:signal transduction histidine kinase